MGFHVNAAVGGIVEKMCELKPPAVVVLDGAAGADWQALPHESPQTLMFGRLYQPQEPGPSNADFRPQALAVEHVNKWMRVFGGKPFEYAIGLNEPVIPKEYQAGMDAMKRLADFDAWRCELLGTYGRKAAIGNFSVGCPETYHWQHYYQALAAGREHGAVLALHQYWPTQGLDHWRDWLILRHRQVYNLLPAELRLPLVVTETGLDQSIFQPSPGGWNLHLPAVKYLDALDQVDAWNAADPYHIASCIYCAGNIDAQWWSYDVFVPDVMKLLKGRYFPEYRNYEAPRPGPEPETLKIVRLIEKLPVNPDPKIAYKKRTEGDITLIAIHHSGPPGWLPITTEEYCRRIARNDVRKGWPGASYAFVIGQDGTICQVNELTTVAYHASSYNAKAVGICVLGDFRPGKNEKPTMAQLDSLDQLVRYLLKRLNLRAGIIKAHRELMQTACPGGQWFENWRTGLQ
jgi:hypothetical protein